MPRGFRVVFINSHDMMTVAIRLTRSIPIKQSGTGRARSAGVVGVVYLARHRSGFLPENFGHVQKSSRDREAKRSRSHLEVIEYWLSSLEVEMIGRRFFTIL